jgi:hypothetical protein
MAEQLTTGDLVSVLDLVRAAWEEQWSYAHLVADWLGPARTLAALVAVATALLEQMAEDHGMTRDETLATIREAVAGDE